VTARYLIDTHVWLWMNGAPERLGTSTREVLSDAGTEIYFSAASGWEIAIKTALGKLELPAAPSRYVPQRLADNAIQVLPVTLAQGLGVESLPHHHRDPFDRLLVVQAGQEKLTLITADERFEPYGLSILWAHE
jgi:PIN domain nuclease of toxin-antitoxin system